jgi:hypothetical protein
MYKRLLPFDIHGKDRREYTQNKSSRCFLDEDVPGGASAYMFQQVFEGAKNIPISGLYAYHDFWQRRIEPPMVAMAIISPNQMPEQIFEAIYGMMSEVDPDSFPSLD